MSCKTFRKPHWGEVGGKDLLTTEVWAARGLVRCYVLFLIDLRSGRVHIAGATSFPGESFMVQVARNLTDEMDGVLLTKRVRICDRDARFTGQFEKAIEASGVRVVVRPYQARNCNAHAERFMRSIEEQCLHRRTPFGERSLLRCLREFTVHYHAGRNHQGIGN